MSSLQKRALMAGMPRGLPPRPVVGRGRSTRGRGGRGRVYTPLHWSKFFDSTKRVEVEGRASFNVYEGGLKHGDDSPWVVLLHGGGFSGLTWAPFSRELTFLVACRTLAIDLRGHGLTTAAEESDLSAETMSDDIAQVIRAHVGQDGAEIILIGHSMGGALAVHTALGGQVDRLVGLVVVDVVEGTAMDALSSMQSFLKGRPKSFPSLSYAIEWALKSGQTRNTEAARISMPGQLRNSRGKCAAEDVSENEPEVSPEGCKGIIAEGPESIPEEEEEQGSTPKQFKTVGEPTVAKNAYTWRTDLAKTEPFWAGWFANLSANFLGVAASKMLVLAGVDRLDRELTVGQMQGKFQMQVLAQAGHAVHEDVPEKMAECVATFLVRNKFARPLDNFSSPTFPAC